MKTKKSLFTKALSLVLAFVMVLTMAPLTFLPAFAANTWTKVGEKTTTPANPCSTPDSGMYSTSTSASAGNCYTLTKSGSTYTITNTSGKYMNIDASGNVTWSDTAQDITLKSDASSNITAYTANGIAATSVLNGVSLYSATSSTETVTTGSGYEYTLDTDGIDTGCYYLIVAANDDIRLSQSSRTIITETVTISGNSAIVDSTDNQWYFKASSDENGYYVSCVNTSTSTSYYLYADTSTTAVKAGTYYYSQIITCSAKDQSNGVYYMYYYDLSSTLQNYFIYYNSAWSVYSASNSVTDPGSSYAVRLYKYSGTSSGGTSTVTTYTSGDKFTTEVTPDTVTPHYVLYTNSDVTVANGLTTSEVDALIRAGGSTLQGAENSSGTDSYSISTSTGALTFSLNLIDLTTGGYYSVPVYYIDADVDDPENIYIGDQILIVEDAVEDEPEVEPEDNEFVWVGKNVQETTYSTPDSGLYSTSDNATSSNCYTITKSGDTYTVTNTSGKYMNIDASGNVTWTDTAQNITLTSDASGNITAYNADGVAATSAINGVPFYSATSEEKTSTSTGSGYVYTLDTDGIEYGNTSTYLIVGATSDYMLIRGDTGIDSSSVTVVGDTITIDEIYKKGWYFVAGSSDDTAVLSTMSSSGSAYYLRYPSGDEAELLSRSTSGVTTNIVEADLSNGLYYLYYSTSSYNAFAYFNTENTDWYSHQESTSVTTPGTTYAVRLYKYTGESTGGTTTYTEYKSGTQFTPTVTAGSETNHYVRYTDSVITVEAGLDALSVEALIEAGESKLEYAENSAGTGAVELSTSSDDLYFSFSGTDFSVAGTKKVAVSYIDRTADSPDLKFIGYQTVVVEEEEEPEEPEEAVFVWVGKETQETTYSTPDSGMYSISSTANEDNCYTVTKNGDTYTIVNKSNKYMNIDASGNVTWTDTAQDITLTSDASGNITAYNADGVAASSEINGVPFYSVTTSSGTSSGKYIYTLDTDGIEAGSEYLIVGASNDVALILSGTSYTSATVTVASDNTITMDNNTSDWTFSNSSSGTVSATSNSTNYYLTIGKNSVSVSTSSATIPFVNRNNDGYYYLWYKGTRNYYTLYYSSSWVCNSTSATSVPSSSTSTSYAVRLFKYTGEADGTVYTVGEQFTPTATPGSETNHYVRYTDSAVTVTAGTDSVSVEALIKAGSSILEYAENAEGTDAVTLSIATDALTFDFTNVNLDVCGTYKATVYYTDSTADDPTAIEIGEQTVIVEAADWIEVGSDTVKHYAKFTDSTLTIEEHETNATVEALIKNGSSTLQHSLNASGKDASTVALSDSGVTFDFTGIDISVAGTYNIPVYFTDPDVANAESIEVGSQTVVVEADTDDWKYVGAETEGDTRTRHYIQFNDSPLTIEKHMNNELVESLIRDGSSTLKYSESSKGTSATDLSLDDTNLTFDFTGIDISVAGTYNIPVYYTDTTADTPIQVSLGTQTVIVEADLDDWRYVGNEGEGVNLVRHYISFTDSPVTIDQHETEESATVLIQKGSSTVQYAENAKGTGATTLSLSDTNLQFDFMGNDITVPGTYNVPVYYVDYENGYVQRTIIGIQTLIVEADGTDWIYTGSVTEDGTRTNHYVNFTNSTLTIEEHETNATVEKLIENGSSTLKLSNNSKGTNATDIALSSEGVEFDFSGIDDISVAGTYNIPVYYTDPDVDGAERLQVGTQTVVVEADSSDWIYMGAETDGDTRTKHYVNFTNVTLTIEEHETNATAEKLIENGSSTLKLSNNAKGTNATNIALSADGVEFDFTGIDISTAGTYNIPVYYTDPDIEDAEKVQVGTQTVVVEADNSNWIYFGAETDGSARIKHYINFTNNTLTIEADETTATAEVLIRNGSSTLKRSASAKGTAAELISLKNSTVTFDFTGIDISKPGTYNIPVSYTDNDIDTPVTTVVGTQTVVVTERASGWLYLGADTASGTRVKHYISFTDSPVTVEEHETNETVDTAIREGSSVLRYSESSNGTGAVVLPLDTSALTFDFTGIDITKAGTYTVPVYYADSGIDTPVYVQIGTQTVIVEAIDTDWVYVGAQTDSGTRTKHYALFTDSKITLEEGATTAEALKAIKAGASTLLFADNAEGLDAENIALNSASVSIDFTDIDISTPGTYNIPVYYTDSTADTPVKTLVGTQTLVIEKSAPDWIYVGTQSNVYTTPDSGIYSTSSDDADEDNCYTLTKDGNTYTVQNTSGEYMNVDDSGNVTWTDTAQSLTLVSDANSNITAYSAGSAATSVLNGVKLYSVTTEETTGTGEYVYTLDTDGIDAGEEYLIVGGTYAVAMIPSGTSYTSASVTIASDNTITLDNDTSDWTISGSSSGSIKAAYNNTDYYLTFVSSGNYYALTCSTTEGTFSFVNYGTGNYIPYMICSSYKYLPFYNGSSWTYGYLSSTPSTSLSTQYTVRLFKFTSGSPAGTRTEYTSGAQFTAVKTGEGVDHYVSFDDNEVLAVKGRTAAETEAAIRNGTSVLQFSENGDGTDAITLSLDTSALTFDLTDVDLTSEDTYQVPVYYTDATADDPEAILIGYQTLTLGGITAIDLDSYAGVVSIDSGNDAETGANIVITYVNGETVNIPVTVGMLADSDGNFTAANLCKTADTYTGLKVFYNDGTDDYWFENFVLTVEDLDNYPEYPNEGSVRVGKSGTGIDFQTTGVAQIELTATGVPKNPGIDLIVVVDSSSSMNKSYVGTYNGQTVYSLQGGSTWYYEDGTTLVSGLSSTASVSNCKTRLEVARESVAGLLTNLSKVGENGVARDIDVAICTFNGMNHISGETNSFTDNSGQYNDSTNNAVVCTGDKTLTAGAFQNITELQSFDTSTLTSYSGTNYDYAFLEAYTLATAKQAANEAEGEERELYVIFMSDGAPYQYNYFGSSYKSTEWNDWIAGTYSDASSFSLQATTYSYFYNGTGNKHRLAEAIKGDTDTLYTIIDPECTAGEVDVTGDGKNDAYMKQIYGLGAKMYSIAFCITVDGQITADSMNTVIGNVASSEEYFYKANSAEALDDAFTAINNDIKEAATEAYFIDTMGPAYDARFAKDYEVAGVSKTLDYSPSIVVRNYTVYTRADYINGVIDDEDLIGTRVAGEVTTLETITFNDDGTEAYSDKIDGGATNIMTDGIIRSKYIVYNNTSESIHIDPDVDGVDDLELPAESFFWKIGIIADTEYSLSYYVYLTGSMEGERDAGSYPTNSSAVLHYRNYLGRPCTKDTVSPRLSWEAATVNYEFYLVNADGKPVNSSGTVVPFENRVKIGLTQTKTILLNADGSATSYTLSAGAEIPDGYTLFNPDAKYEILVGSGSNDSYARITDDGSPMTTYYYEAGYKEKVNGDISKVTDYGNTHVAFAVVYKIAIINDTVVIDYGLPVRIHALANDLGLQSKVTINSISTTAPSELNTAVTVSEYKKAVTLSLENGVAALSADCKSIVYTPKNATMSDEEVLYYEIHTGGNYYYGKVTIIPATNIYYEETFFTFTDGDGYSWEQAGGPIISGASQAQDRPGEFSLEAYDANNNYGRDDMYSTNTSTYSMGVGKVATVDKASLNKEPKAEFVFCGTGFDLFSVTSNKSGAALVKVESLTDGVKYNKTYLINTYYGYSYGKLYLDCEEGSNTKATLSPTYTLDNKTYNNTPLYETDFEPGMVTPEEDEIIITVNGKVYSTLDHSDAEEGKTFGLAYGWILSGGEDAEELSLYQIPVISVPGNTSQGVAINELPYATYKVTVTPKYTKTMDKTGCGEYKFYIDGIRIYNPAGKGDDISEVVNAAYEDDRESNPQYMEVRDAIIADEDNFLQTISTGDDTTVGGAIFLDGMTALNSDVKSSLNKFKETGPNNETYLSDGQAIAFKPEITDCLAAPASFQLGMKVMKAGETDLVSASIKVIISDVDNSKIKGTYTINIKGSAEQWYDLSDYISWVADEDDESTYKSRYTIVILNDSDSVVSLTSFKWTYLNSDIATQVLQANSPMLSFAASSVTLDFAQEALMSVYDKVDTSDVTLSWVTDTLTEGAKAKLEITTSQDIEKITISKTDITEYEDGEDGLRHWTYEFTVTESGDYTYDITLTDSRGRVSETLTTEALKVEAETTETTTEEETTETEEQTTEQLGEEITEQTEEQTTEQTSEKTDDDENIGFIEKLLRILRHILDFIAEILELVGII